MTYTLKLTTAAYTRDLVPLKGADPIAAARVAILIQELKSDQALLANLLTPHYGERLGERFTHKFGIKYVVKWFNGRPPRNIWRLRDWLLESQGKRYRVIYCYFPTTLTFWILGIAPRSWNYDDSDPYTQELLRHYDELAECS